VLCAAYVRLCIFSAAIEADCCPLCLPICHWSPVCLPACLPACLQDVAVEPLNPHLFWSAAEDGTVRQFDTRIP
jgi:hypothetical protein